MSATDIIAVEQPDGNLKASQFSIRFARKQKIRRVITVFVNGQQIMNNSGTVLVVDAGEVFAKFVKMDTLEDKDFTQNRKRDKFIRHLRSLSTIHQKSKSTDNVIFAPGALPPPTENIMPNPRDKVHMRGFVWSLASKFNQFAEEEEDSSENDSDSTPRTPQSASEILNHATVLRNIENAEKESKNEEKKRKYRSLHLPRFNSSSNGWSKSMGSMPVKHQSSPDSRLSLSNSLLQHIEEEYPQVQHVLAPAEFLQSLCLDREINIVKFLIASTGEEVHAKIFKWRYDTKIIISDVDGTITKSDIKGHIYTRLGRVDYTHEGISALYSQIATNGYKFLYLTARPITHIDFVRAYIEGIYQMEVKMPPGPVITSPNSTFNALAREVVLKRPDLFKKAVLNIVKDCFAGHNPFLAGFGNKHSDCDSYVSVGIDPSRSFRINTKGQVKIAASEQSFGSYLHVKKQINQFFPHMSPLHMISGIGESVQSGVDELKEDFKEKMEDIAGVLKRTKSD